MSIIKTTPDGVSEELAQITSAGQFTATNPPQAGIIYTNITAGTITTTFPSSVTWLAGEQKTYQTTGFSVTAGSSTDTVQTVALTGITTITAWNSIVLIPPLTANITLNYPTPVGNIGKKITLLRTGTPNTFSITHTPAVGAIVFQNSATELIGQSGALTVEATNVTTIQQVSNIGNVPVLPEYGENNGITNGQTITSITFVDVVGGSLTLPSAGTWDVTYNIFSFGGSVGNRCRYQLVKSSDLSIVANSSASFVYPVQNHVEGVTQTVRITTTGADVYKLQGLTDGGLLTINNANAINGGNSKIFWNKISGFAPITGQIIESTFARQLNTQGAPVNGTPLNFENIDGPTPVSGGTTFTLTAGRQYYITGASGIMAGTNARYSVQFFNVTTGLLIGAPATYTSPANAAGHTPISGIAAVKILPTVTTQIQLRVTEINGTAGIIGGSALVNAGAGVGSTDSTLSANWIKITQEGTSAVILTVPGYLNTNAIAYTVVDSDYVIRLTNSNPQTITLPVASAYTGRSLKFSNPTGYNKAFNQNIIGTDTALTNVILSYELMEIQSDGTNWNKILTSGEKSCTQYKYFANASYNAGSIIVGNLEISINTATAGATTSVQVRNVGGSTLSAVTHLITKDISGSTTSIGNLNPTITTTYVALNTTAFFISNAYEKIVIYLQDRLGAGISNLGAWEITTVTDGSTGVSLKVVYTKP